jgi:hypothetical protein
MSDSDEKRRRDRSPSFPYISLREAVDKIDAFYRQYTRHPARINVIAPLMGYSPTSSSLLRAIAALKSFGLISEVGAGADRKVGISDLGVRVVADKRPGIRDEAIKQAFNSCEIFAAHRDKWGPRRPPNDACESELHLDHGFTSDAARKFISVYDDSVAYANIWNDDGLGGDAGGWPEVAPADAPVVVTPSTGRIDAVGKAPVASSSELRVATYPVPEGPCSLTMPSNISPRSAKKLKKWLQLMLEDLDDVVEGVDNPISTVGDGE